MRSAFGLSLVALLCVAATAQLPTASLEGTATDPQGGVVPGARVTIISQATGISREQKTGEDGHYLFTNRTPGSYTVRVESAGFAVKEFEVTIAAVFLNQVLNFSRSRS
jgi:hypothetical protein